ncbi:hypothetical protein [Halomonas mongoliensis]|uniref:hypothetical protein n=1 Tax=Halomonas mongoliensis TaxID=321265 RepID=UPI00403B1A43
MEWWRRLPEAPYHEDENLYGGAPVIRELLKKDNVSSLTVADFELLCRKTHATMDHVIKVPLSILGRPDVKSMNRDERVRLFADMIMKERNSKGWDVRQLLNYVLYGGKEEEMWSRIYDAGREPSFSIPRYGLNSIAEVAGWARPEVAPPRNGRTSKALRALGYDVKIY